MKAIHFLGAMALAATLIGCASGGQTKSRDVYLRASNNAALSSYDLEEKLPDETTVALGNIPNNTQMITNQSDINTGLATNAVLNAKGIVIESESRALSDTILGSSITTDHTDLTNQIAMVNKRVDTEAASRQSADNLLQSSITAEATDRAAGDTSLDTSIQTERTNRIAADTLLKQSITNEVNEVYLKHDFVVSGWINSDGANIAYTEHPVNVTLADGATWSCADGWPETKAVFMKVTLGGSYTPASNMQILGYGVWPTETFQCVVWCMSGIYYVNILGTLN